MAALLALAGGRIRRADAGEGRAVRQGVEHLLDERVRLEAVAPVDARPVLALLRVALGREHVFVENDFGGGRHRRWRDRGGKQPVLVALLLRRIVEINLGFGGGGSVVRRAALRVAVRIGLSAIAVRFVAVVALVQARIRVEKRTASTWRRNARTG